MSITTLQILYHSNSFDENAFGDTDNVIKRREVGLKSSISDNNALKFIHKKNRVRSEESQFDLFGFTVQEHEFFETVTADFLI